MRWRSFDPVAVTVRYIAEFIANHRLRRALPRLDRRLIKTHQRHGGMEEKVLTQVERFESRSKKNCWRLEAACRQHHARRDDSDRPSLSVRVRVTAFDASHLAFGLRQLRHREWRDDARARANGV